MSDTDRRPEPEALLAEAEKEGRGRLKIFLGAAPGVGKTYAMLEAARRRAAEGVDVIAAVVETHGRAETEAMLADLEVLPKRPLHYRGRILHEMDLDALLERRPRIALIDELAHSNVEGSRHEKRWQDVEEVLAAGIDVLTTLNVQHLETLNDRVARISGVRVRETVPDAILEKADEVELVDLPTEELIERLRAGKVYVQDQIARAVQNFFSKGNLIALRELAMRAVADRVDAQLQEHMRANAIDGPWPAQERILVAVNEAPVARTLIRTAKRMADRARVGWIAVTVTSPQSEALTVLILSVRADEAEKVALLDTGAQDYVTKPFGVRELLARLRGLLRDRTTGDPQGAILRIADLEIDAAARTVTKAGEPLKLTRKEFDLLWVLASNAGRLVTQGMALEHVWGKAHAEDSQYLRVFVRQLRAKIGDDAGNPRYIFTEPGVGYRFAES